MRLAVRAAQDAAGAVPHAVARGVAERGLVDLDREFEHAAGPAAVFALASGIRAELVAAEEQRKAHLGHLQAAEFDAARRLPFAGAGPAVAGR